MGWLIFIKSECEQMLSYVTLDILSHPLPKGDTAACKGLMFLRKCALAIQAAIPTTTEMPAPT